MVHLELSNPTIKTKSGGAGNDNIERAGQNFSRRAAPCCQLSHFCQ